jgi:uncharacterized membrane protein
VKKKIAAFILALAALTAVPSVVSARCGGGATVRVNAYCDTVGDHYHRGVVYSGIAYDGGVYCQPRYGGGHCRY